MLAMTDMSEPDGEPVDRAAGAGPDAASARSRRLLRVRVRGRRKRKDRKPRWHLSDMLRDISDDIVTPTITIGDLLKRLEGRAFGALLLIFAFPNVLPAPPGLSGVLGLPLIFLAAQMMLGRTPWLPSFISARSLSRDQFRSMVYRAAPILARVERLLGQRLAVLTSPMVERVLGAICLVLSLLLALPIPLGNMIPALAICIIALGLLERDGYWIIGGLIAAVLAFLWVSGIVYTLVKSAIYVLMNAL